MANTKRAFTLEETSPITDDFPKWSLQIDEVTYKPISPDTCTVDGIRCSASSIKFPEYIDTLGIRYKVVSIEVGTDFRHFDIFDTGNSIVAVGDGAFWGNEEIKEIRIGSSVRYIGRGAFTSDRALTTLYLGPSISYIGKMAFEQCHNLKKVYYAGSKEDAGSIIIESENAPLYRAEWIYNYQSEG